MSIFFCEGHQQLIDSDFEGLTTIDGKDYCDNCTENICDHFFEEMTQEERNKYFSDMLETIKTKEVDETPEIKPIPKVTVKCREVKVMDVSTRAKTEK